jgi:hypothetical protein
MQQQHSPAPPREPPPPSPWVPGGSRLDWMVNRERISGANLNRMEADSTTSTEERTRRRLVLVCRNGKERKKNTGRFLLVNQVYNQTQNGIPLLLYKHGV